MKTSINSIKCIAHTDEGILYIINLINKIKDHNESYFRNTFNFLGKTHPPFKESLIYYSTTSNSFKFILRSRLREIPVETWDTYKCDTCFIRLHKLGYLSIAPFDVVVSGADFLNEGHLDMASYFHGYIQNVCKEELLKWKELLIDKTDYAPPKKLF